MPTKLIPQTESMGPLLAQPETSQAIVNEHPKWALQRKYRNEHDDAMQERHTLKDGFSGFYSHSEPVLKIGDTVKRHIHRPDGQEAPWRPSCRTLEPMEHPPRAYGKRNVPAPGEHQQQELDDLPRGRRRVVPPRDQLQEEVPMFQLKHTVRDAETGKRVADRIADADAPEKPRGPKLVAPGDRRNGVGQATLGDKPYAAVEITSEYMTNRDPARPRLNVEPVRSQLPPVDRWARKEDRRVRDLDIHQVRSLPNY
jgi:hypothetical protein